MNEIIDWFVTHSPALIIAIPLLGAFLTPIISKVNKKVRNIFVIIVLIFTSVLIFTLSYEVITNGIKTYVFGGGSATIGAGDSAYAIRILFEIDGFNAFIAIIAGILPLAAVIYSWAYMKDETGQDKYYTLILLMTVGMLGMIITGDMFNFFVFLEITSISSAALIAFWTHKKNSVQAGFKYIVISSIGALFILFAIAIFYAQYDALNMAVIANNISFSFLDKIALVLLIAALAMKSGIVPMHMWLPDAYGRAPSSVVVVLIGTTLASLYGMIRIFFTVYGYNIFNDLNNLSVESSTLSIAIGILITILAVFTIIIGVFMALKQKDLKKTIAFVAVAEIGYMILAFGAAILSYYVTEFNDVPNAISMTNAGVMALKGGVFHILNDALDVGLLFLVAGAVYYVTKQTSLNKLGGLARNMKYTTVFFVIGLIAVSGLPPLNGFASKLIIYQSTFQINPLLSIIAILCSILILAVFVKIFYSIFLGPKQSKFEGVKEVPKTMLIAMGIIAFVIIIIGLFPNLFLENLVTPATDALQNAGEYVTKIIGVGGA